MKEGAVGGGLDHEATATAGAEAVAEAGHQRNGIEASLRIEGVAPLQSKRRVLKPAWALTSISNEKRDWRKSQEKVWKALVRANTATCASATVGAMFAIVQVSAKRFQDHMRAFWY